MDARLSIRRFFSAFIPTFERFMTNLGKSAAIAVIAGIAGTMLRYFSTAFLCTTLNASFYIDEIVINCTGSFLLGFLLNGPLIHGRWLSTVKKYKSELLSGFFGGFTTFSAFVFDVDSLALSALWIDELAFIIISVGGGLVLTLLGLRIGENVFVRDQHRSVIPDKGGRCC